MTLKPEEAESKKPASSPTSPEAEALVLEHQGWAISIARSVARAWNMDWQLDGLDGAALEALLFCARRFDPSRGVPFKGYARRRIHEASTEEARKSKGWQRRTAGDDEHRAREVSAQLFNIFPELRDGVLPGGDDGASGDGEDVRGAIRQILIGATLIATHQEVEAGSAESVLEMKRILRSLAQLECVHQMLMWKVYWEGLSLRSVADEWQIDELNVVREHKILLGYLYRGVGKGKVIERPKVRPGLRDVAIKLKRTAPKGPFMSLVQGEARR